MRELSKEKKIEIRQTEEYERARKILVPLYYPIVVTKKEIDLTKSIEFAETYVHHSNYSDFKNNCHEFEKRWKEAVKVSRILRGLKTAAYPTPQYEAMSKMFAYLGLVESLGVTIADAILILLIANERAIHTRGPFGKHVTKVGELDKIDLGYKLEFLEDEGFEIFKRLINKDTRNHIAHLKFSIKENGEIRKRDNSPVHIDENIRDFWSVVDVLVVVFEDVGLLSWLTGENPFSIKDEI